jgi:hypothetical protein
VEDVEGVTGAYNWRNIYPKPYNEAIDNADSYVSLCLSSFHI